MKYLSVCSGIEAATVAWHDMGWTPVAFSEIEKFPSQVLNHHYPTVPNVGDMTKFEEWNLESVELLVGGTPCQSFSVAGLRKGLDDPRGNLMLTYGAIAKRFKPKWLVWENVPGVLSSNGGRDFGTFLGMLGELGYGFAYRVLDAQYFGVAQRRRRVFVVGCLGNWRAAAAVLFESDSLRGNPAPSRETGQVTPTLTKECTGVSRPGHNESGWYITASTLTRNGAGGNNFECGETYVPAQPMPINTMVALRHEALGERTGFGIADEGDPAYTLTKSHSHAVAQPIAFHVNAMPDQMNFSTETSATLTTSQNAGVQQHMAVRRLTPVECERLQGFPDNYTNIKENCPDGPRYKALGNSMAVPVMRWIGQRIQSVEGL